jgi:hypothetical protein
LRKSIHLAPRLVELRAKFFPPHMVLMSHPDMIPALFKDFSRNPKSQPKGSEASGPCQR